MKLRYFLLILIILQSCQKNDGFIDEPINETMLYFPPLDSEDWDAKTIESLNWNVSATNDLYDFLSQHGTRGFILLSEGKIVIEKYWGNTINCTLIILIVFLVFYSFLLQKCIE